MRLFLYAVYSLAGAAPFAAGITRADSGLEMNWERVGVVGLLGAFIAFTVKGIFVPGVYYNDAKAQAAKTLVELEAQRELVRQAVVVAQAITSMKAQLDAMARSLEEHRKAARRNWLLLERIARDCRIVALDDDEDVPPEGGAPRKPEA